ncbi:NAD(P)-binding protein [Daldinia caldariorum]|uniref:NAD(P)-binding protein n=1 Tax=Daldinia caldariorum TaxID=326644 RepID=UPI002007C508|nr:NAD(P)-binding protein [Daldinia caldariorum]KAI1467787.1 NAD(P)-binding protein [Daldinia caldariorum]
MASGKKVFIVGPGFIGWAVLDLLVKENYSVTGFVRRQEHADQLTASGAADTVLGDLNDTALITKHALSHDVVIHTATADHLPSVEAILEAVQQRAEKGLSTIFIHTSGTSLLDDGAVGAYKGDKVFRDDAPAEINALPDTAPHRRIDLAIVGAQKQLGDKAKIAIMIPPTIYGYNPRHGRLSIQVPVLTRYALKHGYAGHVGAGRAVESNVHVNDLARGYVALLHHLEASPSNSPSVLDNPYYFCESTGDDEPSWRDVAALIGAELHKAGLIADPEPRTIPPENYGDLFGSGTLSNLGLNSRSRAVRLRALGWRPVEKSLAESFVQDELPVILKEGGGRDWKALDGYHKAVSS